MHKILEIRLYDHWVIQAASLRGFGVEITSRIPTVSWAGIQSMSGLSEQTPSTILSGAYLATERNSSIYWGLGILETGILGQGSCMTAVWTTLGMSWVLIDLKLLWNFWRILWGNLSIKLNVFNLINVMIIKRQTNHGRLHFCSSSEHRTRHDILGSSPPVWFTLLNTF